MTKTENKDDWDLVAWIRRGPSRKIVFELLAEKPKSITGLREIDGKSWRFYRGQLDDMIERDLVVELTSPEIRYGKIYGLTEKGKEIAKLL